MKDLKLTGFDGNGGKYTHSTLTACFENDTGGSVRMKFEVPDNPTAEEFAERLKAFADHVVSQVEAIKGAADD